MRIAINTLSLNRTKAGMGNYICNLVNNLARMDRKNSYHILVSDNNGKFFRIRQGNFRTINLGKGVTRGLNRFLWEQFSLPGYLKKNRIDILHSPGFVTPLMSKAKNIVSIADMTFINYPEVHTLFKRAYFRLFMPRSIRNADKILAISESTKKDILKLVKVDPEKIKVTHLAHGREFSVKDKKKARAFAKTRYGINPPFILFVGMIEPRKNLERLFRAFLELKKEGIPHELVIVGKKGWKYKGIFKTVKELMLEDDIIFTGYVPDNDLAILYNASEMLAYPCLYEGFGIPILEAMACGCPVITSNVSSMPEVAGDAALLVNPEKTGEIASAMRKVIYDERLQKELKRKGKLQSSRFSWENTARQTLTAYEKVGKSLETIKN